MSREIAHFLTQLLVVFLLVSFSALAQYRGSSLLSVTQADTIENFESGTVAVISYPGHDQHPSAWRIDSLLPHSGSRYSLKLWGNTWKVEQIAPRQIEPGVVWQVAAYVDSIGEAQGFGLVDDSSHAVMYSFAGTQILDPTEWITVYQGAFSIRTWNLYQLPVADDWLARYGYVPRITGLLFINGRVTAAHSVTYFDDIIDITSTLPSPPRVSITYTIGPLYQNPAGTRSVDVQFFSQVVPDSGACTYLWDFGDAATSALQNPAHTFLVLDNHPYTVLLRVRSQAGRWGRASCQIQVDPGPGTFPIRMNFVGDIMMARRYEQPGGIIPTQGVQAIFAPTRSFLGDAADITVGNLESPLTNTGTPHPTKSVVFRSSPANVAGLVYAGVDVVTIANNHVIDYGYAGLQQMQSVLRANNIVFSGAGADSYEAFQPAFYSKSGICFAFVASSDRTGQYNNEQPYLNAGFNKPGFTNLTDFDLQHQIDTVRRLADLVVAEMHSGVEYGYAPLNPPGLGSAESEEGDEEYSPAFMAPTSADIQIRQQAIDYGADLVICHHPHILQGFQVYRGKLIAHSLGNFAFDLDYPETMPTAILNASIDQRGFYQYSVTPVFIDHYIPRRATGGFGLHLLDYLARRSRDLGTYFITDSQSVTGAIVLDTTLLRSQIVLHNRQVAVQQQGTEWVSDPIRLERSGSISSIESIAPSGPWQYRLGRDVIWFGNFESEGCSLWTFAGSEYDSTIVHSSRRSLLQGRTAGTGTLTADLEKRFFCDSAGAKHSMYGWIKTSNANSATLKVKFYNSRTGTEIGSSDLGTLVNGTTDWTFYSHEFTPTAGTTYFDLQLTSTGPSSGTGYTWFDDVGIVRWSSWRSFDPAEIMVTPNDYYWLQIKTPAPATDASVAYKETRYDQQSTGVGEQENSRPTGFELFQNYPNPFNPSTSIRFQVPGYGHVKLTVYDLLGRETTTLVNELKRPGTYNVSFDGRRLASGVYFARLQAGGFTSTRKMLLLK